MREIKDVEQKLRNDPRRLNAYKKYQKYEAMLKQYNKSKEGGIEIIRNISNPFSRAGKIAEQNEFTLEEYEKFCDQADKLIKKNPDINLNDLSSQAGRKIIGNIICEYDENFKIADLDSVAVAKYYSLYKAMDEAQGKSNNEIVKILMENKVTIAMYEAANKKMQDYERNNRRELYERRRKGQAQNLVHTTAAVLEIGPGEAEDSLEAFEVIEGKYYETEFDKSIRIRKEEVHRGVLDKIIMDDRLTDEQKKEMIDEEYNKVADNNKFTEATIQQWINNGRDVKDMPKDYIKRHGIVFVDKKQENDEREIG